MTVPANPVLVSAVRALRGRKAEHVVVLDLRPLSTFTDFFVVCHGMSDRQVKSLADEVEEKVRLETKAKPVIEGYTNAEWILLDYQDVIVHLFQEHSREFYRLESLWGDCPTLPLDQFPLPETKE